MLTYKDVLIYCINFSYVITPRSYKIEETNDITSHYYDITGVGNI